MSPLARPATLSARRRLGLLLLAWGVSGVFVVGPGQVGVVRLCGRAVWNAVPGVWWRPPWPLSVIDTVSVFERRQVGVGVTLTNDAVGRGNLGEDEYLTGDQNLVRIQATVQYSVHDPRAYLFGAQRPDDLVAAAVQAELTSRVALEPVDSLMTSGREPVRQAVLESAQDALDGAGVGVRIESISLRQILPPPEVAVAFNDVSSARQDADRKIKEARGYENETLPRARGEADELMEQAKGYRLATINRAQGDADRFRDLAAEFRRAPQVTRIRLHLETVERIAPKVKTMVVDADGGRRPIDLGVITTDEKRP